MRTKDLLTSKSLSDSVKLSMGSMIALLAVYKLVKKVYREHRNGNRCSK